LTKKGRTYFYNKATKTTSWKKPDPSSAPVPPTDPPPSQDPERRNSLNQKTAGSRRSSLPIDTDAQQPTLEEVFRRTWSELWRLRSLLTQNQIPIPVVDQNLDRDGKLFYDQFTKTPRNEGGKRSSINAPFFTNSTGTRPGGTATTVDQQPQPRRGSLTNNERRNSLNASSQNGPKDKKPVQTLPVDIRSPGSEIAEPPPPESFEDEQPLPPPETKNPLKEKNKPLSSLLVTDNKKPITSSTPVRGPDGKVAFPPPPPPESPNDVFETEEPLPPPSVAKTILHSPTKTPPAPPPSTVPGPPSEKEKVKKGVDSKTLGKKDKEKNK